MYICEFSCSVGAGKATTRKTRGLTCSVIAFDRAAFANSVTTLRTGYRSSLVASPNCEVDDARLAASGGRLDRLQRVRCQVDSDLTGKDLVGKWNVQVIFPSSDHHRRDAVAN